MLVMDIERPVNRAQEARLALIDPLGQGMIEEEGLDNLDLVLAKIDQVAKLQKPRIAKTMDFVMAMAWTVNIPPRDERAGWRCSRRAAVPCG